MKSKPVDEQIHAKTRIALAIAEPVAFLAVEAGVCQICRGFWIR